MKGLDNMKKTISVISDPSYGDEEYDNFDADANQLGKVDMESFMN